MKRRITAILLTTLIMLNMISGLFAVVCHGNDGHIEVAFTAHNECECSSENAPELPSSSLGSSLADHSHCEDFAASVEIIPKEDDSEIPSLEYQFISAALEDISEKHKNIYDCLQEDEKPNFCCRLKSIILLL